jgi:hypothetical protein
MAIDPPPAAQHGQGNDRNRPLCHHRYLQTEADDLCPVGISKAVNHQRKKR